MVPDYVLLCVAADSWPLKNGGKSILFSLITYQSNIMTPCNDIPWNSVGFYPK